MINLMIDVYDLYGITFLKFIIENWVHYCLWLLLLEEDFSILLRNSNTGVGYHLLGGKPSNQHK